MKRMEPISISNDKLPLAAMHAGADMAAVSMHNRIAYTKLAAAHRAGGMYYVHLIINLTQTTSGSIRLQYLDISRAILRTGRRRLTRLLPREYADEVNAIGD